MPWAWSAALGAAVFACDALLAPHAIADGDAGELTRVLLTGGVAHPTGYAVFAALGHVFVAALRALGAGYAWAANLWAALGGAVAALLLHRTALALLPASRAGRAPRAVAAAVPALALALHPSFVTASTSVEVYGWHVAWVCGATLSVVRTLRRLADGARPVATPARMLAWGGVCGLGAAHHATSVFFAAAYTAVLAWSLVRARAWRWWIAACWLAGGSVPLALAWGGIALRAAHPGGAAVWPALAPTARGLWEHVTAAVYRGFVGGFAPDADQAAELSHAVYPFLWPGLAGLIAWAVTARSAARPALLAIVAAAAVQLAFAYRYGVADPVSYFLAPLALALLAVAWPLHALAASRRMSPAALAAIALALLAPLAAWGTAVARARADEIVHYDAVIRAMWHAVPDGPGIFLWASDSHDKVMLYQFEGEHRELDVWDTAMLCKPWPEERFRAKYGFDPLANNGPEHAMDTIPERYFCDHHALLGDRFLARVDETIADSARAPVYLFHGERMRLRRLR